MGRSEIKFRGWRDRLYEVGVLVLWLAANVVSIVLAFILTVMAFAIIDWIGGHLG